jgi:hypothetical protein
MPPEHNRDTANPGGEFQFTVNITPNDYTDGPIVPAEDGLLTAPDGSVLTPYSLLELSQKSATTQRRQRKKTNDRGGDYIPRPPNPFILFRCWYTAKVHKPGSHDNADGSLSSLCGSEWTNLGTQQRRIFEEAAKIEKLKHAERYPNYRYKPIHKKKHQKAAAAAAAATADAETDEFRPTRTRTKKISGSRSANRSNSNSVTPTSAFPGPPPAFTLPAGLRHRRSSSVPPLPSELKITEEDMAVEPAYQPIQLPAAPFLALAGQDMPLPRKSRPSLGWDWNRGMSQILPEPPVFVSLQAPCLHFIDHSQDYTALRTSIPSVPHLGAPRHRAQLPTFHHTQYTAMPPPQQPFFAQQFAQQESTIQWTNPNPFASTSNTNSPGQHGGSLPQLGHTDSTSSSSCSAPSPPPELEISPLDQVPGTEPFDMNPMANQVPPISNVPYHMESQDAQPFDLGIFKKSLDLSVLPGQIDLNSGGRPRGMSIFDDPPMQASSQQSYGSDPLHLHPHHQLHPQSLSNMSMNGTFASDYSNSTNNDMQYSRALNTSNILAGIPAHDDLMEGFA